MLNDNVEESMKISNDNNIDRYRYLWTIVIIKLILLSVFYLIILNLETKLRGKEKTLISSKFNKRLIKLCVQRI